MTVHHVNHSPQQENGHSSAPERNGPFVPALAPPAHADLDALCLSVMKLARDAPKPPLRIKLQDGHMTVELEWPEPASGGPGALPADAASGPGGPGTDASGTAVATVTAAGAPAGTPEEEQAHYVLAPTVGTFYHAPEPGAPPFVAAGDVVRPGQQVGIIEVMKMMSPVEATAAGRVKEFLVPDAEPVEFEQRLIALEPLSPEEA